MFGEEMKQLCAGSRDELVERVDLHLEGDPRIPDPDRGGLDPAADTVTERFGAGALVRASLLRTGEGWAAPLLPDD